MGKQLRPPYRLYQRGRIWHAYYSIVGQGRTRIQLRESTGRTQYDEAQQYAIKRAAELQQETQDKANGRHPTITIDKAFGRYWVEKGQYQTRPQAILLRLKQIKSFLDIEFLHELSNPVLSQYVTKRRQSVANATINRELAILSAIRNLANDFWDVETNRANPQKFKLAIPAPQINNILPDMQQAEKILEHAAPHLKPIILTALYSCMRRNNILSLKWSNLDFVNNFINIKVKDKNTVGGKNHTIPMLPELKELLQRQPHINEYVFNYHSKPIKDIKHSWHSIFYNPDGTSTGIPYMRFHDLRHTGLTWIVRKTGNILLAKKIAGHSSVKVTEIYAHSNLDDAKSALEAVFHK